MEKEYKYGIFIGRFQPFHNSHLEIVKQGLEIAEKLIIVVGSCNGSRTIKNPFTFEERKEMILKSVPETRYGQISIVPIRDYYYNDNAWFAEVQSAVAMAMDNEGSTCLLGTYKDASSWYLNSFPQWDFIPFRPTYHDGEKIREMYFNKPELRGDFEDKASTDVIIQDIEGFVPSSVYTTLKTFSTTPDYMNLIKEFLHIQQYKESWSKAPFPPTFVTTDAVVIQSGHVLVVRRKFNPGKGLFALPGGFVKPTEKIRDAALRELKEETGIKVDKLILDSRIVYEQVFDNPGRSLRGRTITHAFCIKLKDGELPQVKGNDDASTALWMPLMDVAKNEDKFFEDHAHIIYHFISKT